jgi:hypothetical protein
MTGEWRLGPVSDSNRIAQAARYFPMFFWCFLTAVTATYWLQYGLAIQKIVKPPEGVTFSDGSLSLGREADCKDKANTTCDNIW